MALSANKYQKEAFKTMIPDGIEAFLRELLGDTVALEDIDWERRDKAINYMKLLYCTGKLNGEAGEVAEEIFKTLRDGGNIKPRRDAAIDELGDVLWYVSACCMLLGVTLEDLMEQNLGKVRKKWQNAQKEKYAKAS